MFQFTPMPVRWQASLCVVVWLALFCAGAAYGQTAAKTKSVKPGVVRIKVTESFGKQMESANMRVSSSNVLQTGIQPLDKVHQQFKARNMKRVFPYAGKFEKKHRQYGLHLWYEVAIDSTVSVQSAISSYQGLSLISRAEAVHKKINIDADKNAYKRVAIGADGLRQMDAAVHLPNDPDLGKQWHYNNTGQTGGKIDADINLFKAWGIEAGRSNVIVAITDGGVQVDHPDLKANMWVNAGEIPGNKLDDDDNGYVDDINGYSFVDERGKITPHPHGTHIAGTIAATNNNGVGVAGVAGGTGKGDGVRIMTCAVYKELMPDLEIDGGWENTYIYAADNGAVISQNSWGYPYEDYYEQSIIDAINYFIQEAGQDENGNQTGPMKGGIVIFAVGNSGMTGKLYPAYYERTLAVSGLRDDNIKADYSNFGDWVDVAAPGGNNSMVAERGVLSTAPGNGYAYASGTSMACPHVVGVAALIVSRYGGKDYTPEQLRAKLLASADDIDADNGGYAGQLGKRINAFHALQDENDGEAPAGISDLAAVSTTNTSVTLAWTAPSDPGAKSASYYDMRYSASPITAGNFESADPVSAQPKTGLYGSGETFELKGLTPATRYYIALRSRDYFGNTSVVSNSVEATTAGSPVLVVDPGTVVVDMHPLETVTREVVISNTGQGELEYNIVSPDYAQLELDGMEILTFSKRGGKVAPGKTDKITLTLKTDAYQWVTSFTEYYTVTSNDPNAPAVSLPLQFTVTDTEAFPVVASSVNFGKVVVETNALRRVIVKNGGSSMLTIAKAKIDHPDFSVQLENEELWLFSYGELALKVFYRPSAPGVVNATLTFETNIPGHEVVSVALTAEALPAPGIELSTKSLTASLPTDGEVTRQVTIKNTGTGRLTYSVLENGFENEPVRMLVVCPDGTGSGVPFLFTKYKEIKVDVHTHLYDMTVQDMLPYDVVFVMNNDPWRLAGTTPEKVGDLLADYIDAGGKVIVNEFVYTGDSNPSSQVSGRFLSGGYGPFLASHTFYGVGVSMEELLIPEHPVLKDVKSLTFSGDLQLVKLDSGAVGIAKWSSGEWMVGAKPHVIGLNLLPISIDGNGLDDFWSGELPQLLRNSVHWLAGSSHLAVTPAKGSLEPGASAILNVKINANALATGQYKTSIGIASNVPSLEQVIANINLTVQGPDFAASADSVVLKVEKGAKDSKTFTLTNEGTQAFPYALSVRNVRARILSPAKGGQSGARIPDVAKISELGEEGLSARADARTAGREQGAREQSARLTSEEASFATTFEGFANGEVNDQENWQALGQPGWTIGTALPASGKKHLVFTSDGSTQTSILLSPFVGTGPSGKTVCSMKVWFKDRGTTFEILPLTYPSMASVTSIRFGADGTQSAQIYNEKERFTERVPFSEPIPEGYFLLSVEVEHATSVFKVYFDQTLVYSGIGLTSTINALAFQTRNEDFGQQVYVDDISITDGGFQELPAFLKVTPASGALNGGQQVIFITEADAGLLKVGNYLADLVVNIGNGTDEVVVPVRVQVTGPSETVITPAKLALTLDYRTSGTTYFEVNNTGGAQLNYQATVSDDAKSWISINPASGNVAPAAITVARTTLDAATLEPGEHTGTITVTSSAINQPETDISITLKVLEPAKLDNNTQSITAQLIGGFSIKYPITLKNVGVSVLNISWSKANNSKWLIVDNETAHLVAGESRAVTVKLDATTLAAGHYEDVVILHTNDPDHLEVQIPVTLDVTAPPKLITSVESINVGIDQTGMIFPTVDVKNTGAADLMYQVTDRVNNAPTEYHGGPNQFGYTFIDTRAQGGPAFRWQDIRSTGTEVFLDEMDSISVDLPFAFPFYGVGQHAVKITSDGILAFGNITRLPFDRSLGIPDEPNNMIAARWQDMDPSTGGTIHYRSESGKFTVQYTDVPLFNWGLPPDPATNNTFQIVLFPDGAIALHYLDILLQSSETIGIENDDASDVLQIKDPNTWSFSSDSTSILIAAPRQWLSVMPHGQGVGGGEQQLVTVQIDIAEMVKDEFAKAFYITSNDQSNPIKRIPITYGAVTGIGQEQSSEPFRVYPVPAADELHVSLNQPAQGAAHVLIRNAQGQFMATTEVSAAELTDYTIDLAPLNLTPGVYFLQIEAKPGTYKARPFIKE